MKGSLLPNGSKNGIAAISIALTIATIPLLLDMIEPYLSSSLCSIKVSCTKASFVPDAKANHSDHKTAPAVYRHTLLPAIKQSVDAALRNFDKMSEFLCPNLSEI